MRAVLVSHDDRALEGEENFEVRQKIAGMKVEDQRAAKEVMEPPLDAGLALMFSTEGLEGLSIILSSSFANGK